jgi:hypothetical protein
MERTVVPAACASPLQLARRLPLCERSRASALLTTGSPKTCTGALGTLGHCRRATRREHLHCHGMCASGVLSTFTRTRASPDVLRPLPEPLLVTIAIWVWPPSYHAQPHLFAGLAASGGGFVERISARHFGALALNATSSQQHDTREGQPRLVGNRSAIISERWEIGRQGG